MLKLWNDQIENLSKGGIEYNHGLFCIILKITPAKYGQKLIVTSMKNNIHVTLFGLICFGLCSQFVWAKSLNYEQIFSI